MGVLTWIIVGLVAGWLAGVATKGGGHGLVGDVIIGVVGALLGGYLATQMLSVPNPLTGFNLPTLVVAFLGSVLLIWIIRMLPGRSPV